MTISSKFIFSLIVITLAGCIWALVYSMLQVGVCR